ncbi:hypothetical protein AGMMS50229_13030 [Campylobacterota bacterium]|nr:hypothetical protein AGMMS50229_13030 [Campylobacterota bacterium]
MAWFVKRFDEYKSVYKQSVLLSAHKSIADKDLKRAMVTIDNGIKDSFHFMTNEQTLQQQVVMRCAL